MSALNRSTVLLLAALAPVAAMGANPGGFTNEFPIAACEFESTGGNAFLRLQVNRQLYLSNKRCKECVEEDGLVELWITILPETRVITFPYGGKLRTVRARVMEEYETEDGELEEVSKNYVADCNPMNDVYYFGEDSKTYKGGKVVSTEGSWISGVAGAKFGLAMPARPKLGTAYYQELAPKVAMDRAEVVSVTETVKTPAGEFQNCVKIKETTPMETGVEYKLYAPQVGLLRDGDLNLVKYGKGSQQ